MKASATDQMSKVISSDIIVPPFLAASHCYPIPPPRRRGPFAAAAILGSGRLQGIGKSPGCDCPLGRLCAVYRIRRRPRRMIARLGGKGASVMAFKVYSGPVGTDAVSPIQKDR